jgi:hypothetical protein
VTSSLDAACSRKYTATRHDGTRGTKPVLWIVMHCTEGATAEGAASWFANEHATGSAHLVVDAEECFRCLRDDQIPWAAPGANVNGFHVEQAGFAHWSEAQWLRRAGTLERAAWKTAAACRRFNVPTIFRTASNLRARVPGVTTHAECTRAFGGTHTDPGSGWPRARFMDAVRVYHGAGV